jgi:hypothetical protein
MKHYGIKESDLIEGIKVGNPDLTGAALFQPTKVATIALANKIGRITWAMMLCLQG